MTAIRLERVRKIYGSGPSQVAAVDDVSLVLKTGELTFLLGPSGCGKTTLLRMIAGFVEPTAGEIYFDDRNVSSLPANRRNTGMVFQSYALWPHMSVAENVAFGLDVRKTPKAESAAKVAAALEMVKMAHLGARKPTELSGGQQQRVALARALVFKPDVLLLDEPLSNLDAKLRLEMRTEIRRIVTGTGITAVYVTHDQEEALSVADSMVVLKDGRFTQEGKPRELYRRPESRFVADFLGETNFVAGRVVSGRDDTLDIETPFARLSARGLTRKSPREGNVTVSLRPEALHVATAETPNAFRAEQVESIYLGKFTQHRVRTAVGIELKTLELNPRGLHHPGAPVTLAIDPDDVVVLAD
ncbi:MAG: ABC transporter ATP-binding protein [Phycisphaerae bacterium]|nr:ABC transporter ATP-binding protein [Phycisphaerae bacterium]